MIDWLWGSVWAWAGGAAVIVAGALAVAWFIPPLRKYAIMVAGAALAVGAFAARVAAAAKRQKQKEWDNAIKRDVDKGNKARRDADRDVASGRVSGDEWDRDKRGM